MVKKDLVLPLAAQPIVFGRCFLFRRSHVKPTLKTTYFLGAGASAAVTPNTVMNENLLARALALRPMRDGPQAQEEVRRLVRGFSVSSADPPTVDELLAVVDLALAQGASLGGDWTTDRLRSARKNLVYLIRRCVEELLHERFPTGESLGRLAQRVRKQQAVVISLNWDCLFERALAQVTGREVTPENRPWDISYGIPCHVHGGRTPAPTLDSALLLLKPHGSLNWGVCHSCQRLCLVTPEDMAQTSFPDCKHCGLASAMEPVIVPPTPIEVGQPYQIHEIWQRCEECLSTTDNLVFIGYSLPVQDVDVRLHLVRALSRRRMQNRGADLRVTVVSKHHELSQQESFRYRRILGAGCDYQYLAPAGGLEEWLAQTEC